MNISLIRQFDKKTQNDVLNLLMVNSSVVVTRSNGKFSVFPGNCLSSSYADDHKTWNVCADDIFTDNEKAINYINSFSSYPVGYKGKKDYKLIKLIGQSHTAIINNGKIEIVIK